MYANRIFSLLLGSAFLFCDQVKPILVREPVDVLAVKGTYVVLQCYTNHSESVSWEVQKTGDEINWENLYNGSNGDIPDVYQSKYNVSVDATRNQYNLTIKNVQPEDSGTYRCGDNMELSLWNYKDGIPHNGATAELVVIDQELKCWQETSEWNFDQDQSNVDHTSVLKMKCNVTYRGNLPPTLSWSLLKQQTDINGTSLKPFTRNSVVAEGENFLLSSELIMNTLHAMDQTYVKCEVSGLYEGYTDSRYKKPSEQVSWTSGQINFPSNHGDESNSPKYLVEVDLWLVSAVGLMTCIVTLGLLLLILKRYKCVHRIKKKFFQINTKESLELVRPVNGDNSESQLIASQNLQDPERTMRDQNQELSNLCKELTSVEDHLRTVKQSLAECQERSDDNTKRNLLVAKTSLEHARQIIKSIIRKYNNSGENCIT